MDVVDEYFSKVNDLLSKIISEEKENIEIASGLIADNISEDKIIHTYGPGHALMTTGELFFRAAGLAPVNLIYDSALSITQELKCIEVEQVDNYTLHNLDIYDVREGETIIIVDHVAVKPSTLDIAKEAQNRGINVVGISSKEFCESIPEDSEMRHDSKKDLSSFSDVFIDTYTPVGDGIVDIEGVDQKVSPFSTLGQVFIANAIVAKTAEILVDRGEEPPVLKSVALPDAERNNENLMDKYSERLKHLY